MSSTGGEVPVDEFIRIAVEEARSGMDEGGLPVGAVLVVAGSVLGRGRNRIIQNTDPTAHAEVECLRAVGRRSSYRSAVLYTTMAPCLMCCGAIQHFGIRTVVVGETHSYPGYPEVLRSAGIELVDLDLDELRTLVEEWINNHPQLWHEAAIPGRE